MELKAKIPEGTMNEKWTDYKGHVKLVNPANKRKLEIIVVGTGLAGASAAASLGELGYKVKAFCFQDSPRRAHSIAAQGGINAAKNYQNDGDSVFRLFYDTVTIILVILCCINAALCCNTMCTARTILETKCFHFIAQFPQ